MVHIDILTNEVAIPFTLDAEEIDNLIQKVEDAGVSVVGDDGGPTDRQILATEKKRKKIKKKKKN